MGCVNIRTNFMIAVLSYHDSLVKVLGLSRQKNRELLSASLSSFDPTTTVAVRHRYPLCWVC
jgi:hypothetical protein